jgi:predicted nucleic acid-binding protein
VIVTDTNIIAYLLLPTPWSTSVDAVYAADSNWVAPLLWKSEFRNVLALYMRKQLISLEQAIRIQDEAESLMAQNDFDVPSARVLALVNQSNCSSYDCEFVALAHQLNTKLITQDKPLLTSFPATAISIDDFLAID